MNLDDLSPEVLEKAKACKTPEELMSLAAAEGIELSEEVLDAVAGGASCWWKEMCPEFGDCASYCGVFYYHGVGDYECTLVSHDCASRPASCGDYQDLRH